MLEAKNISHNFDYLLFEDINFTLPMHESLCITGQSGCGKSTLLHIASTLLSPNKGEIFYKGKSIYQDQKTCLDTRRYDFGIIFQAHYLLKGFSAAENIYLSTLLAHEKMDEEILKKLNIQNIIHQKVGSLSGGEQQRVSIARVLAKKPRIIFADEPTGNLDSSNANHVFEVLFDYIKSNQACLFLVTHDMSLAQKCDQIYRLSQKSLISI